MRQSTIVICKQCNNQFSKSNKDIKRSPNNFCSRHCSVTYNNTLSPKKKFKKQCTSCNMKIKSYRKYCDDCYSLLLENRKIQLEQRKSIKIKQKQIKKLQRDQDKKICINCNKVCMGIRCNSCHMKHRIEKGNIETIEQVKYKCGGPSCYAKIRTRARAIGKLLEWKSCRICGYTKHIEIAHIKSITSFPQDTPLKIVNDPNNLIPLCPNCHWELDHNLLTLD